MTNASSKKQKKLLFHLNMPTSGAWHISSLRQGGRSQDHRQGTWGIWYWSWSWAIISPWPSTAESFPQKQPHACLGLVADDGWPHTLPSPGRADLPYLSFSPANLSNHFSRPLRPSFCHQGENQDGRCLIEIQHPREAVHWF